MNCRKTCWAVLSGLLLALMVLASCSDNPAVRVRYEAEKKWHAAERGLGEAQIKPDLVDDAMKREIAAAYGETFEFCLEGLESVDSLAFPVEAREIQYLAYQSASRLAQLYASIKRFDTCIHVYNNLLSRVPLRGTHRLTTFLNLGQALHGSGDWDSARVVYDRAIEQFYPPTDSQGEPIMELVNVPAHMFNVADLATDTLQADTLHRQAVAYYQRLTQDFPGSDLALVAWANLSRLHDRRSQWPEAINALRNIRDSLGLTTTSARLRIADITASGLGRLNEAMKLYDEIEADLVGPDTGAIPLIWYKKAVVLMSQEKYADARELLEDIRERYPRDFAASPMAQYTIGRSFELQGNWNRALTEYQRLMENYRGSDEAMSIYLYLASELEGRGRQGEAERWYADAEEEYNDLASRGEGTITEARALLYKANLYQNQDKWQEAADILTGLFNKYPNTTPGQRAMLKAAAIYRARLNQTETSDSLIQVLKASLASSPDDSWEN